MERAQIDEIQQVQAMDKKKAEELCLRILNIQIMCINIPLATLYSLEKYLVQTSFSNDEKQKIQRRIRDRIFQQRIENTEQIVNRTASNLDRIQKLMFDNISQIKEMTQNLQRFQQTQVTQGNALNHIDQHLSRQKPNWTKLLNNSSKILKFFTLVTGAIALFVDHTDQSKIGVGITAFVVIGVMLADQIIQKCYEQNKSINPKAKENDHKHLTFLIQTSFKTLISCPHFYYHTHFPKYLQKFLYQLIQNLIFSLVQFTQKFKTLQSTITLINIKFQHQKTQILITVKMGNKDSSPISTFSDWEKVDTFNGIQIYRNKKNNQLAQKRIITVDPQYNMKQQLKVYSMREHNGDGLVRALAVEDIQKQTSSQGLCSSQKKLMVLTEKMPYRLSQLPQLTFPQTLLILRQSLRGYQRIYKDYGPVQVSQQLIGLNYFGEVKCWLNENWALNHRSHEYMNLKAAKVGELTKEQYLAFRGEYLDQSEMVRSIVKAVEGKCEEGKFPVAFQEEVENQAGSFKKLALYLKDFVQYNEIFVPEKLQYEALVKVRYQERLQHQLQIHSGQNTQQQESQMQVQSQDTVANNFIQSIFQLQGTTNNPNLPKQTQQIPSQFPVPQPTKALTPGLSSKQSPSGDTLGHITFTPSNRAYNFNEQSNQFSSGSSKNIITNGNSFQATPNWKSNLQTVETTYYNGSNGGIGTVGSSSKIPSLTTPTKPQIPSYQPTYAQFTTSTYEPYQPTFSKYDSFSTVSNNTSIPSSQPASKYSYTYSNSFASSSQFGGLNQSGSINGNGLSGNGLNGNGVSNYSLSYGTLKNSEASYTPNSTAFGYSGNGFGVGQSGNSVYSSTQQNVVQPYSKSSTYEERAYGGKVQQGTLFGTTQTTANATTYEQFKKQFNQGNIIDGRTGQLVSTSQTPNTNPSQLGYTLNTSSPTTAYNFSTSPSFQLPSFTANSGTTAVKTTNQPSYQSASNYSYKSTYTTGQPSTGFSFNGNDALNGKFNVTGYEGKGYTNTLTKYQTTTTKQSSQPSNYMQAFTSLLSPQIQQKMSQANFTSQSNFHEDQPQINVNTVSSKSTTPVASPRPSQTYSQNRVSQGMATSNLTNEQQNKSQNNFLAGLAKMVERASNEVSDSVAKEFSN